MARMKGSESPGTGSASTARHFPNVTSVNGTIGVTDSTHGTVRTASAESRAAVSRAAVIAVALRPTIVAAKARK